MAVAVAVTTSTSGESFIPTQAKLIDDEACRIINEHTHA